MYFVLHYYSIIQGFLYERRKRHRLCKYAMCKNNINLKNTELLLKYLLISWPISYQLIYGFYFFILQLSWFYSQLN